MENKELKEQIMELVTVAKYQKITTQEELTFSNEFLKKIKDRQKKINDTFNPIKTKAHDAWKEVCNKINELITPLKDAEKLIKRKMGDYEYEQEKIRLAEQKRLQDEARKAEEERLLKIAEETGDEKVLEEPVIVPTVTIEKPVLKGTYYVDTWLFKVTDSKLIPDEYKVVDEKKIGQVVRSLKQDTKIPGIEVYTEQSVRQRS